MSAEAAFVAEYNAVLKGLVRNEKPQINMLSMLAEDNKDFAAGIVGVINQHILTVSHSHPHMLYAASPNDCMCGHRKVSIQHSSPLPLRSRCVQCPPPAKLPALYLVDSIVKNVGEPYKSKFSERLPEVRLLGGISVGVHAARLCG